MGLNHKIILLIILVFASQVAHTQISNSGQPSIDIMNLIPKSPQADQLVKVNEITVNMARGVPNISFTLYTATVGSVKIPVTISYDASGIKFDDVPSSVGLKWTLQAGGEISRNINGRSDDSGYFANASSYTYERFAAWNIYTDSAQTFFGEVANNQEDISQDEYSFNYLDQSGYLYYRNGKLLDLAAPFTHRIQTDSPFSLNDVRITDEEGNTAWFAGGQDRTYMTLTGSGYYSPYVPPFGITAWKMSKLQTYTNETATFDYDTANFEVVKTQQESYSYRQPISGPPGSYTCNCGTSSLNESGTDAVYNTSVIKDIYTPNETVSFYYHTDNTLGVYTRRLDSMVVRDKVFQKVVKKVGFKYGKYATVNYLRLDTVYQYSSTGDSLLIAAFQYGPGGPIGLTSFGRDIFGYNNNATNTYLISTNDANYPYTSAYRDINPLSVGGGILDSITYPTGGKVAFFYSPNSYYNGTTTSYGRGSAWIPLNISITIILFSRK